MNIIASLTHGVPEKAEAAIEDMAVLSRLMHTRDENYVPVKNQIDVAKKYLALEALRLDNRLTVNGDIGEFPHQAIMPVFTPQPILDNAIRHGMEEIAIGGVVDGRWWEENDQIHIRVNDPIPTVRARQAKSTPGQSFG